MDMILVDWTRMGKTYCLAGVVREGGLYRVVRPLLKQDAGAPVRNVGWFPRLIDGHARWEVFELIRPEPAASQPPHQEDCWVRAMRSRRRSASPEERRAILTASVASTEATIFGVWLTKTHMGAYVQPGTGIRSLATIVVPSNQVIFGASVRQGASEADVRVTLPVPGVGSRSMPVKDHGLLLTAERLSNSPGGRAKALGETLRAMGADVAVRLGLSRPFQAGEQRAPVCWLMADGFFSIADPQP
jgi:hypothetical protein